MTRSCLRSGSWTAVLAVVLVAMSLVTVLASPGEAGPRTRRPFPAPVSGPALSVPTEDLAAALRCYGPSLRDAKRSPVLLSHATAVTAETNFARNYVPALTAQGYPVCTVEYPAVSMGDIQVSAEYVVYAVRRMAALSHRQVSIVAHSQGGLQPRWALRYWRDVRQDTAAYVAWGTPQHGTTVVDALCLIGCAPALQQMRPGSAFIAALNRGKEVFGRLGYTTVSTQVDEFVQPQPTATALAGASNIVVQSVCPGHVVDHIELAYDPVVFAVTMDALTHGGRADPARIDRATCSQLVMPYATLADEATLVAEAGTQIAVQLALQPHDFAAPALPPYAR